MKITTVKSLTFNKFNILSAEFYVEFENIINNIDNANLNLLADEILAMGEENYNWLKNQYKDYTIPTYTSIQKNGLDGIDKYKIVVLIHLIKNKDMLRKSLTKEIEKLNKLLEKLSFNK